jgi:hypothetical protein
VVIVTMAKREIVGVIVMGTVLAAAGSLLYYRVVQTSDFSSAIAFITVASFTGAFVWGFGPRIENAFRGKTKEEEVEKPMKIEVNYPQKPIVSLEPLPHFKGRLITSQPVTKELGGGLKQTTYTNDTKGSTDEFRFLQPSQQLHAFWGPVDQPFKELVVKFGVIRVRCLSGDMLGCKIEGRMRVIESMGKPVIDTGFGGVGYFNWYSLELKRQTQGKADEIDQKRGFGLNPYLKNVEQDIHEGEEKDVLLFYMIEGTPSIFLCTSLDSQPVSINQAIFQLELSVTAEKYPKAVSYYYVKASWDDYTILRIQ